MTDKVRKFERTFGEFRTYIERNDAFIVNYRDRYFYGEPISTAFVESAVNQVIHLADGEKTADAMVTSRSTLFITDENGRA